MSEPVKWDDFNEEGAELLVSMEGGTSFNEEAGFQAIFKERLYRKVTVEDELEFYRVHEGFGKGYWDEYEGKNNPPLVRQLSEDEARDFLQTCLDGDKTAIIRLIFKWQEAFLDEIELTCAGVEEAQRLCGCFEDCVIAGSERYIEMFNCSDEEALKSLVYNNDYPFAFVESSCVNGPKIVACSNNPESLREIVSLLFPIRLGEPERSWHGRYIRCFDNNLGERVARLKCLGMTVDWDTNEVPW